jgi:putative membrane protein
MKRYALAVGAALLATTSMASAANKGDQQFLEKAIQGNLTEIQMGRLAEQKGQSEDVKSFGQMLVTDHSQANDQAKQVASQMGITAPAEPSAKQQEMYKKMSKLSGVGFDRAFAKEMIADHKKDISEYKRESQKQNDPAAQYAKQSLPVLQKHLNAAEKLGRANSASH